MPARRAAGHLPLAEHDLRAEGDDARPRALPRRVWLDRRGAALSGGRRVEVVAEPGRPWRRLLRLDGEDCSHVDLQDPGAIDFAYVRRLADVVDVLRPPGAPITALHLGGGGFTLPRYVAHTRPGSRQVVAEVDAELVELARTELGLVTSKAMKVRIADAGVLLERRSDASADLVVLDAFVGTTVPPHLVTAAACAHAARIVVPAGGIFCANVIDEPPLAASRALAAELRAAFAHLAVVAARKVLRGRVGGNVVLLAGHAPLPVEALARRALRGASPELVVDDPW